MRKKCDQTLKSLDVWNGCTCHYWAMKMDDRIFHPLLVPCRHSLVLEWFATTCPPTKWNDAVWYGLCEGGAKVWKMISHLRDFPVKTVWSISIGDLTEQCPQGLGKRRPAKEKIKPVSQNHMGEASRFPFCPEEGRESLVWAEHWAEYQVNRVPGHIRREQDC